MGMGRSYDYNRAQWQLRDAHTRHHGKHRKRRLNVYPSRTLHRRRAGISVKNWFLASSKMGNRTLHKGDKISRVQVGETMGNSAWLRVCSAYLGARGGDEWRKQGFNIVLKPMVFQLCCLEPLRDNGMRAVGHREADLLCSGPLTPTFIRTVPSLLFYLLGLLSQLFLKELFWSAFFFFKWSPLQWTKGKSW